MWKPPGKDYFEVQPVAFNTQWGSPSAWVAPVQDNSYQTDIEKKKQFGIALSKQQSNTLQAAFKAGCEVFPNNTTHALWVANNWVSDPIVIEAHNLYAESLSAEPVLLDKEQFAAKVLELAEEKVEVGGKLLYVTEAKDRLGFLRLYAEVRGYIGKNETNNNFNFTHNEMKIKLVKPEKEKEEIKTIDAVPNDEISNTNDFPVKLKIVKSN